MKVSKRKLKKLIVKEFKDLIDEEALINPSIVSDTGAGTIKLNTCNTCDNQAHSLHHKSKSKSGSYMAKQHLDKISTYSKKVYDMICHGEQIDDWMESHIAQMADDIGEVYHKLHYNKKVHRK